MIPTSFEFETPGVTAPPTRALTILQPWAWAIAEGIKTIENRSWPTKYRGSIYVHAGRKVHNSEFVDCAETMRLVGSQRDIPREDLLVYGALIAVVDLVGCSQFPDDPWSNPMLWNWKLANPRPLPEPIPMRGSLGLWKVKL